MRFKFIGGESVTVFGFHFEKGKTVDVPDDFVANTRRVYNRITREYKEQPVLAVDKLLNHPEFREVKKPGRKASGNKD